VLEGEVQKAPRTRTLCDRPARQTVRQREIAWRHDVCSPEGDMRTIPFRLSLLALLAGTVGTSLVGCGSSSSSSSSSGSDPDGGAAVNVSGTWSGTLTYKTTSALVPSGSTSMTFTLSQGAGSDVVAFTSPPAQGNGVKWTCPQGTISGETISFPSACTLTNTLNCTAQATPSAKVNAATGTSAMTLTMQAYSYVWTGTSCSANNVTVNIAAFDLARTDSTPK
jgi:hypothetical protein